MERQRKIKVLTAIALIVAVFGLTVAFAAMSTTLTINGTANLDAASWDIHFENMEKHTEGDATFNQEPVVDGTTIRNIDITLTKPNDIAGFATSIVNNGSINAKISSVEISPLCTTSSPVSACDWNNDGTVTEEDVQKVNDNISFFAAYTDNSNVLKQNDILNAKESRQIAVMIGYGKAIIEDGFYDGYIQESTELPERDLTFDNLSITINYVQAD